MVIPKILQAKELRRNNEEGMEFRAVVLHVGTALDHPQWLTPGSVTDFNAQRDSQDSTGEQFTDMSESQVQKCPCTSFHNGHFYLDSRTPSLS